MQINLQSIKQQTVNGCKTLALLAPMALASTGWAQNNTPDFSGTWQIEKPIDIMLTAEGETPPLLPEAKALYSERMSQFKAGDYSYDESTTTCRPPGNPRIFYEGMPFVIVQNDNNLVFRFQWNQLIHYIRLNEDPGAIAPTYLGTSAGWFDDDTLVNEAQWFREMTLLDDAGMPHSMNMILTERFKLVEGGDVLEMKVTIDDPETFFEPWDTLLRFNRVEDGRLQEDYCMLRERLAPERFY